MRRNSLLTATALSLALHGYIAWSLLSALRLGAPALGLALAAFLASALLTPAPLLIRLNSLPERLADALAWAGYSAMGVFSSLLLLTLGRDIVLTALVAWNAFGGNPMTLDPARTLSAIAVLSITLFVSLVGFWNARRLAKVVTVTVPIRGLPPALSGFTIVQLSDLHVGPTIKRAYLASIVRRVNGLNADLVAITGDLIDGGVARLRQHVQPLEELSSRHGTYCVTGNHEYYHGVEAWLTEWRRLGLRVLINENRIVDHDGERLLIGGVTDFSAGHFDVAHRSDPQAAAYSEQSVAVKVLLAHQPRSATEAANAGFDVQLSGHTHGGQFLPWNFFVPMQQPFVAGLNRLRQLWIYTSRGTGYWGPPLRFGAPSEITRLQLVPAPA